MLKKYLLLALCLFASVAQAGVVIIGTRIIYPAQQKNVSVQLSNMENSPALIQAWIDNGDPNAAPETIQTPFVITPPLARIEGNKGQTLRITYTGEPLPQDRESVFYFNLLDIPPKPQDAEIENYLQIAVRSRIKLFYRPQNLAISPDDAYQQVQWHIEQYQGKPVLVANNTTPYFITYNDIKLQQGKSQVSVKEPTMVAPFSQHRFALSKNISSASQVVWTVITDYGAKYTNNSALR